MLPIDYWVVGIAVVLAIAAISAGVIGHLQRREMKRKNRQRKRRGRTKR